MDLLATVRKEGSRGGRADFKWSDVQNSTRREHYLGHSLMAPVGRWAKGRDLNWYAKGDEEGDGEEDPVQKAARERKEEIRRVKEAEEDALARALGLPVPDRNNANMEPVSDKRHTDENAADPTPSNNNDSKGRGYRETTSSSHNVQERSQNKAEEQDKELQYALREHRRRHRDDDRPRSGHGHDRDRDRNRDRRRHASDKDRDVDRQKRRERDRDRHSRRSRSRSPTRREQNQRVHERSRSRSPYRPRRSNSKRH